MRFLFKFNKVPVDVVLLLVLLAASLDLVLATNLLRLLLLSSYFPF